MKELDFDEWLKQQPKKTEYLRFKLGVKFYRVLGYRTNFVRDAEEEFVYDKIDEMVKKNPGISLVPIIKRLKSLFQAKYGLTRKVYYFDKGIVGFIAKELMFIRLRISYLLRKYKI